MEQANYIIISISNTTIIIIIVTGIALSKHVHKGYLGISLVK